MTFLILICFLLTINTFVFCDEFVVKPHSNKQTNFYLFFLKNSILIIIYLSISLYIYLLLFL